MSLGDKLNTILIKGDSWKTILGGLGVTIQISALALLLGAVVHLLRTRRNTLVRGLASAWPLSAADSAERSSSATWAETFSPKVSTATITGLMPARTNTP